MNQRRRALLTPVPEARLTSFRRPALPTPVPEARHHPAPPDPAAREVTP